MGVKGHSARSRHAPCVIRPNPAAGGGGRPTVRGGSGLAPRLLPPTDSPSKVPTPQLEAADDRANRGHTARVDPVNRTGSPLAPTCLVVTHDSADLDALASQVAVQRLRPGAVLLRPPMLSAQVRDFLALHKERFTLHAPDELSMERVQELVVVDVRRATRLAGIEPLLERMVREPGAVQVTVYDHHEPADDDIGADELNIEPLGAAVTLLVERIQSAGLLIDPVEATLYALGIYADTGALTYAATTPRDVAAVAWLATRGFSFSVVRRYLDAPLDQWQRHALASLLGDVGVVTIRGVRVGIATVQMDKRARGLAEVVTKALSLHGLDALFALFHRGKTAHSAARARVPYVDVGEVLAALGGGGHGAAGAAILEYGDTARARLELLSALETSAPRPVRVRHVMSSPVRTLDPTFSLAQAAERLARWEVSGAPVVRDGDMAGIISRRDIEAARRDGRLKLPVTSCMSCGVHSVGPDETIEGALALMTAEDVGRLPVREAGNLIGITTRSDLLRHLYPT